jgi:hypothetical protein
MQLSGKANAAPTDEVVASAGHLSKAAQRSVPALLSLAVTANIIIWARVVLALYASSAIARILADPALAYLSPLHCSSVRFVFWQSGALVYAFTSGTGAIAYAIFPVPTASLSCTAEANPSGKSSKRASSKRASSKLARGVYHPPDIQGWAERVLELSPLLGKSGSPLKGEKGKTCFMSVRGRWRTYLSKAAPFDIPIYKVRYRTSLIACYLISTL